MALVFERLWGEMVQQINAGHGDLAYKKFEEAIRLALATKR